MEHRIAGAGGILLFLITWLGTFIWMYNTMLYPLAGSVAATVGAVCFLIVHRNWHPRRIIKPLLVVAIIALSKLGPYAEDEILRERATSCVYGDHNLFGWSVASTEFDHEGPA